MAGDIIEEVVNTIVDDDPRSKAEVKKLLVKVWNARGKADIDALEAEKPDIEFVSVKALDR